MLEKDVGGIKKNLNQISFHTNFKESHLCHIHAHLHGILTLREELLSGDIWMKIERV